MKAEIQPKPYMSSVPAVEQTIAILTYLASAPGLKASLTDIARVVGIYKSKAQAILATLEKHRWVSRSTEDKLYSLGLGMAPFGRRALDNLDYRNMVKPFLAELAQETRCTAQLSVISGDYMVVVALEESGQALDSRNKVGFVFPILLNRVHGKILLSCLPDEEREQALAEGKFNRGRRLSGPDLEQLKKEMAEYRSKGFGVDLDTPIPMIKLIASPVFGPSGYPIGMIFIVGVFAKTAVNRYGSKLREAARRFSALLGSGAFAGGNNP